MWRRIDKFAVLLDMCLRERGKADLKKLKDMEKAYLHLYLCLHPLIVFILLPDRSMTALRFV
jgi:hypothetical protein